MLPPSPPKNYKISSAFSYNFRLALTIGTLAGTFGGILVSNKLTTYRIEQLEQKVAAHNSLVERTYKLEGQMTEVQHDIRDLKSEIRT